MWSAQSQSVNNGRDSGTWFQFCVSTCVHRYYLLRTTCFLFYFVIIVLKYCHKFFDTHPSESQWGYLSSLLNLNGFVMALTNGISCAIWGKVINHHYVLPYFLGTYSIGTLRCHEGSYYPKVTMLWGSPNYIYWSCVGCLVCLRWVQPLSYCIPGNSHVCEKASNGSFHSQPFKSARLSPKILLSKE